MFEKIIVGVDGRGGGRDALALARRLATPSTQLIATAVCIVDHPVTRSANAEFDSERHAHAVHTVAAVTDADPSLDGEVAIAPSVAEGLHGAAERHRADLIVIGSCMRGALGRILSGDDTRGTTRDAPCAVAVAPRAYTGQSHPIRTIGLAWDGGEESVAALALARSLAGELHAGIRASAVIGFPTWPVGDAPITAMEADVDVQTDHPEDGIPAFDELQTTKSPSMAVDQLARFAEHVDVLVIGSRGRGTLGRIAIGSVSEGLMRRATKPLIVVPRVSLHTPSHA